MLSQLENTFLDAPQTFHSIVPSTIRLIEQVNQVLGAGDQSGDRIISCGLPNVFNESMASRDPDIPASDP